MRWLGAGFLALGMLLALIFDSAAAETSTVRVKRDDPKMIAAYAQAREGLAGFLAVLDNPPQGATNFVLKIGLADTADGKGLTVVRGGQDTALKPEFFWVGSIKRKGSSFEGTVSNTPAIVRNAAYGQTIFFEKDDISDWMYRVNGKIVGNATACPLIAQLPAQERQSILQQTGLTCE